MTEKHKNALIDETSPYLLQHAHNPVNWVAWNYEILEKAQKENKLLLISIGYAACHWCHVMEHECFEDEEVAQVMNSKYINIKVDREERPDVDQIYMDALQMMTGSGGWPLNIIALPDGRPFWGATYVKKQDWIRVLNELSNLYVDNPQKTRSYAENLANGIKAINLVENKTDESLFSLPQLEQAVSNWSNYFDTFLGGFKRAPKFMMPVNLNFLLHYGTSNQNQELLDYVNTTLTRMAWGGIFDHVGGGFSRYAVDNKWHVPHFEKMLYDNGQLVSLYSKAYAATKNQLYKTTVEQTLSFIEKELMHSSFGFFSSLDADSLNTNGKLKEGAYYVWQEQELKVLLKKDFIVFKDYFNINSYGYWEDGNYVLIRDASVEKIAKKHNLPSNEVTKIIARCIIILDKERATRNRPRLDDKILTSWNGLMLNGLIDAYRYLENETYLELALKNASFLLKNVVNSDGSLWHNHKNGKSSINGYLEDYASVIQAFINLFEVTFNNSWLKHAQKLTDYCIKNFFDTTSGLFHFTSKKDAFVIRRTLETSDNVVPASNSIMAHNLFKLSKLVSNQSYEDTAVQMLKNVQHNFDKNAQNHANWLSLLLCLKQPFFEIAAVGKDFKEIADTLNSQYLPNVVIAGSANKGSLPLLQNRYVENETLFYVCEQGACQLPVKTSDEVLQLVTKI